VPGGGFKRFVSESWAELKKVEWPTQSQVIQGTIVVIIACAIVGAYLWFADLIFKPFVRDILLR
jgi:preprotein translocase subunit SecE